MQGLRGLIPYLSDFFFLSKHIYAAEMELLELVEVYSVFHFQMGLFGFVLYREAVFTS